MPPLLTSLLLIFSSSCVVWDAERYDEHVAGERPLVQKVEPAFQLLLRCVEPPLRLLHVVVHEEAKHAEQDERAGHHHDDAVPVRHRDALRRLIRFDGDRRPAGRSPERRVLKEQEGAKHQASTQSHTQIVPTPQAVPVWNLARITASPTKGSDNSRRQACRFQLVEVPHSPRCQPPTIYGTNAVRPRGNTGPHKGLRRLNAKPVPKRSLQSCACLNCRRSRPSRG